MTQYMIAFDDGDMVFPEEDLPDVARASQAVVQEARDAGVWVFGAGLEHQDPSVVATDGTVTDGPYPESKEHIGGFAVVDVPSREEALAVGRQDRRRLSLCATGVRAPARRAPERVAALTWTERPDRLSQEHEERDRRPGGDHPGPPRGVGAGGRRPDQAVR